MEPVALGDGSDTHLAIWGLDADHPTGRKSQRDRCEALTFKIRQGPRYARTGFSDDRHVVWSLVKYRASASPFWGIFDMTVESLIRRAWRYVRLGPDASSHGSGTCSIHWKALYSQ